MLRKLNYILNNQLRSLGALRATYRANNFHHVQASQDELAEPFKYSKTFSRTSTPLWRIEPLRIVQHTSFEFYTVEMLGDPSASLGISPAGSRFAHAC